MQLIDLVVPVYNSLHHVRSCLRSIIAHAQGDVHLYVIDDGSQPNVHNAVLKILQRGAPGWSTLIKNERNIGYLRSVNSAGFAGTGEHVVFINSDTVVPPGFVKKVEEGLSKSGVGVLSAVSNWANWSRVCWALPPGHNIFSLNRVLAPFDSKLVDIQNASGFFFATPRRLFEELGGFDEAYGAGYWEEADYCMKALDRGYRVTVDPSLFVYHDGWGSFQEGGRNENMAQNKAIFMSRWETQYKELEKDFKANHPIPYMSHEVLAKKKSHPSLFNVDPKKIAPRSDAARMPIKERQAQSNIDALKAGAKFTPATSFDPRRIEGRRPKVTYILPAVGLYGGIISVLQVVNQLLLNGFDANVVTWGKVDEEVYKLFPCFFSALKFDSQAELVANLPDSDLIVATSWDSVFPAVAAAQNRPYTRLVYFVQDFEPDFFPPEREDLRLQADRTYHLIDQKIVKTRWLKKKVAGYGGSVHRIPLGLNLDYFYNRGFDRPRQVISLGRPSSQRRNFPMVLEVFQELKRRDPSIELALYGYGYNPKDLPVEVKDYGRLSEFQAVAQAMNDSAVLLDCSTFQGFGRPGLEAMASGTVPVLTHEGGITQYAKHEYNCFLIDPENRQDIVEKVLLALDDMTKRAKILTNGRRTAEMYSLDVEGQRTAKLFNLLMFGGVVPGLEPEAFDRLELSIGSAGCL